MKKINEKKIRKQKKKANLIVQQFCFLRTLLLYQVVKKRKYELKKNEKKKSDFFLLETETELMAVSDILLTIFFSSFLVFVYSVKTLFSTFVSTSNTMHKNIFRYVLFKMCDDLHFYSL